MDLLSSAAFWIELIAAILVILVAIGVLYNLSDLVKRGERDLAQLGASPAPKLTLAEQLKRPSARPFCYVNSSEIKALYPRSVGDQIAGVSTRTEVNSRTASAGVNTPVVAGAIAGAKTTGSATEFEGQTDEQLAEQVMRSLVEKDRVAFGLESGAPDQAKINAIEEGLRNFAKADAEGYVDSRKLMDHKERLASGGTATRGDKAGAISAAMKRYNYIALVGKFACTQESEAPSRASLSIGAPGTDGSNSIKMEVCGVTLTARVPVSGIKPHSRESFEGASLENVMVFGEFGVWNSASFELSITPLVVSLNWTQS